MGVGHCEKSPHFFLLISLQNVLLLISIVHCAGDVGTSPERDTATTHQIDSSWRRSSSLQSTLDREELGWLEMWHCLVKRASFIVSCCLSQLSSILCPWQGAQGSYLLLLCHCTKSNKLTCPLQFGMKDWGFCVSEESMLKMPKIKKLISYYTSAWSLRLVLHGCWRYKGPLLHFITLHRRPHPHRGPLRSGASSRTCACLMQRKGHDLCLHTPDKTRGPEGLGKRLIFCEHF